MRRPVLIVGAGLFGAVLSRQFSDARVPHEVIEKRSEPGGNCHSHNIVGIEVHSYGPHIFHTGSIDIWEYANRFAEFAPFVYRPKACVDGKLYSFPINMLTLHQIWGVTTPAAALEKIKSDRVPCDKPRNCEDWLLSKIGRTLYEMFFEGYTTKQWRMHPSELPSSLVRRIPVRLSFNDNYFSHPFQGVPKIGYTKWIRNIMAAEPTYGVDFHDKPLEAWLKDYDHVFYAGPIDRFFGELGRLEYRTVKFSHDIAPMAQTQGSVAINYCDNEVPHTRVTEHRFFMQETEPKEFDEEFEGLTVKTTETPQGSGQAVLDPQYPVLTKPNLDQYGAYIAKKPKGVTFCGRLGSFKYRDMDQTIGAAIACSKKAIESRLASS